MASYAAYISIRPGRNKKIWRLARINSQSNLNDFLHCYNLTMSLGAIIRISCSSENSSKVKWLGFWYSLRHGETAWSPGLHN